MTQQSFASLIECGRLLFPSPSIVSLIKIQQKGGSTSKHRSLSERLLNAESAVSAFEHKLCNLSRNSIGGKSGATPFAPLQTKGKVLMNVNESHEGESESDGVTDHRL